ncbi:hypothetical protein AVEN_133316-1 [Araneus ventricosus]|uniref:Integrase catalytic domain-containing protein n=1 Tax=Araneus ventricosus TaxID=182803 RepID=A0A4Y2DLH9_ARAVE|nr:hypothetical protein AVEN_133316-1 [Araneus ventricosus]
MDFAVWHTYDITNFNPALFTELCKLLGIPKTRTTALHPESDGMVERFNRKILNHLSLFVSKNQTDWDTHLPLFLLAYRSADHEATGAKLQQNWEEPYAIVKKVNNVIYRVQRSPNAKPKVIHINRLTPYLATDHSSV